MIKSSENNLGLETLNTESYVCSIPSELHPDVNEDSFFRNDEKKTYGVFDGVGGSDGGQYASSKVKDIFKDFLPRIAAEASPKNIKDYYERLMYYAKGELQEFKRENPDYDSMDTTASALTILPIDEVSHKAFFCNVGDSRIYTFRKGRVPPLELQTFDDGYIKKMYGVSEDTIKMQDYVDNLTSMPHNPQYKEILENRNKIYNSVATHRTISVGSFEVRPGDLILMTTDGIHDPLTKQQIQDILYSCNPELATEYLVKLANEITDRRKNRYDRVENVRGKYDDRTAILIEIS